MSRRAGLATVEFEVVLLGSVFGSTACRSFEPEPYAAAMERARRWRRLLGFSLVEVLAVVP